MAQMYNPLTRTTYTVDEANQKVTPIRPDVEGKKRPERDFQVKETFAQKHPRLAQLCLILGVMTAMCTMAIGLHELSSGDRVEFVDMSPIQSRNIEDHRGFFENTFCKGGRTSQFCR